MKTNRWIKKILLLVAIGFVSPGIFAITCTPSSASLTITAGGPPQTVSYTCTVPFSYTAIFAPPSGITMPDGAGQGMAPFSVTVSVDPTVPAGDYTIPPPTLNQNGHLYTPTSGPLTITVSPSAKPSVTGALSCPASATIGQPATCTVTLQNANAVLPTNIQITPSLDSSSSATGNFGTVSSCQSGTPVLNSPCSVTFTFTPTGAGAAVIGITYLDTQQDSVTIPSETIQVPAQSPPVITWTPNFQITYKKTGVNIAWSAASVSPTQETVSYSINDTSVSSPAFLSANQLTTGSNTITVIASAANATSVSQTTPAFTWPPISPAIGSISIKPTTATIAVNGSLSFSPTCTSTTNQPITPCPALAWTSTNPSFATIDSSGVATGVAAGSSTITAASDDIKSNGATLTVQAANSGVSIAPTPDKPCSTAVYLGTTSIICAATVTNNMSNPIFNVSTSNFSTSVAEIGGQSPGTVASNSACGQIPANGGTCIFTFTFTPTYYSTPIDYKSNQPQVTVTFTYGNQQTVSTTIPMLFKNAVNIKPPQNGLSCTATSVTPDTETNCTLEISNLLSTSIAGVTLTPLTTPANTGEFTVTTPITTLPKSQTGVPLTYTAPKVPPSPSVALSVNYTDSLGDNVTSNPVTMNLQLPLTASGIRCNPEIAAPNGTLDCNIILTNVSSESQNGAITLAVIGGTPSSTNPTATCLQNMPQNTPCTVPFTITAGSGSSIQITASSTQFPTQVSTIPIYSTSGPQIQANPISCQPTGSGVWNCSGLFRNWSTSASVGGINLTPVVTPSGAGNITNFQNNCAATELGFSPQPSSMCTYNFTFTAANNSPSAYAVISITYLDNNKDAPAFLRPAVLPLLSGNDGISVTVNPNTNGTINENAPTSTQYGAQLPVSFNFVNNGSPINTPVTGQALAVTDNGLVTLLPQSVISSNASPPFIGPSSCVSQSSMGNNAGCNLNVSFTPALLNGFIIGDHVKIYAWLQTGSTPISKIGTWDFAIGSSPVFGTVVTNHMFMNDTSGKLIGAFVFGNHGKTSLPDLRNPRVFLPYGFVAGDTCPPKALTKFASAKTCSQYVGASGLPGDSYCYVCFNGIQNNYSIDKADFEAQLVYGADVGDTGSVTTAKRIIPASVSYRTLTIHNSCPGTIWPTFISGAAYLHCTQDSDCPVGVKCYVAGGQCQVPPTSFGPCGQGTYTYPGTIQCSKGCNTTLAVCPDQSKCNPNNGLCYWSLPTIVTNSAPTGSNPWGVQAGGQIVTQVPNVPLTDNGAWSIVWSGAMQARTGCDSSGANCMSSPCSSNDSSGSCSPGVAPLPPATQAEFTFLYSNQDYYDVEIINGVSIPIAIQPDDYAGSPPIPSSPYTCSASGALPRSQCDWNFGLSQYNLPNKEKPTPFSAGLAALHYHVESDLSTPASCNPTGTPPLCTNPKDVCGLSQANATNIPGDLTTKISTPVFICGKLVGVWSANQLCANNPGTSKAPPLNYETLNCGISVGNPSDTLLDWFGCNGGKGTPSSQSCYQAKGTSPNNCCGCPFWDYGQNSSQSAFTYGAKAQSVFQALFPPSFVMTPPDQCHATSLAWTQNIQGPWLVWMKQGCSSLYTFAYDDPTSTFTCSTNSIINGNQLNPNIAGTVNTKNYTIRICPNRNTGSVNQNQIVVPAMQSSSSSLKASHFSFLQKAKQYWHKFYFSDLRQQSPQ